MSKYLPPLKALLLFFAIQLFTGLVLGLFVTISTIMGHSLNSDGVMTYLLFICNSLIIAIMWWRNMVKREEVFSTDGFEWTQVPLYLLWALCFIFGTNIIVEFADLSDNIFDTMQQMSSHPVGILAIAVAAPVAEEMIFREALLGGWIRQGMHWRWALLLSSFLFGAIHFNPVQIPFAMAVGLVLGFVYMRTRSIVVPCIIHVVNNGLSVLQMNILGESAKDFKMVEASGGPVMAWCDVVLAFALGCCFFYVIIKRKK